MSDSRGCLRISTARWGFSLLLACLVVSTAGTVSAQQSGPAAGNLGPTIDRRLGEGEQIRLRHEWFFSSRTAGAESADDRAALRWAGVQRTRSAIELQQKGRLAGRSVQQNPWVSKGPSPSTFGGWTFGNVAGRVSTIAGDWAGGVLYVGTASGGLWKSFDDGNSWTQLLDSAGTMTVGTVAVDPNDSSVIWAGTGENGRGCESYFGIGLLRSSDGGQSWEVRNGTGSNTLDELASFANVIIDPRDSNHIVTGGRIRQCSDGSGFAGGLYTTTDGGINWINRLSSVQIYEIAQDPLVQDIFWAATDDGIYKSDDNGVTWILQTASGLPNVSVGRAELAIAPSSSNVVYALFSGGGSSLWRTTDGGTSWNQMASGGTACDGQCSYNMVLRVHRTDPDTVYRGTVRVFRTTNGGSNWSDLTNGWGSAQKVHQDTHHILMHPTDTETFYVGSDGGIWKTVNSGTTFSNRNGNLNVTQFYAVGVAADDPDLICGGAQDNSSLVRTTSNTWDLQTVTGDGFVCGFNPDNSNIAYITSYPSSGYPNVWRSLSGPFGGFSDISGSGSGIVSGDRSNWVTPYIIDPVNPDTLYLGTHRVYRSDNKGSSWTLTSPDLTGNSSSLKVVEVNRNFPQVVYSGSASGKIWRSPDGGANWIDLSAGLPGRSITDIAADPTDPDRAFAVVGGFNTDHLWEWTLSGGWTSHDGGLPNVPTNTVMMLSATDIMVGSDTGIFRSFDGGQTFLPWMDGLPLGLVVSDLKYNPLQNVMTAGTYGRGAWQTALGVVSPILLYESASPFVEVDGNGNAHIEPGESWSVDVTLRNGGGANAFGVQARLSISAPGVTLLNGGDVDFGDINAATTGSSLQPVAFVIDPGGTCGDSVTFDLVDLVTASPPEAYGDMPSILSLTLGGSEPPIETNLLDEDFEPAAPDWAHEAQTSSMTGCTGLSYFDEWHIRSKDAAHGDSYHLGNGPGLSYNRRNFAWLLYGGKDSAGGAGVVIPADAIAANLTLEHWYDTVAGADGAAVLIDAVDDGQDNYVLLQPVGGYPGGALGTANCNGLGGLDAFQGDSGGWTFDNFNLMPYVGQTVYLAFVFGSDFQGTVGEGWYVDDIKVDVQQMGASICETVHWPSQVPQTVQFDRGAAGSVDASWSDACNVGDLPAQQYSIQVGDLDLLHATGSYSHMPRSGACGLSSPANFTAGAGNEYYLVVPNEGGHDGGAGVDSSGNPRAATNNVCGESRIAICP